MSRPLHCLKCLCRRLSPKRSGFQTWQRWKSTMASWQISRYGGNNEMNLTETTRVPSVTDPHQVLVEVHAASVNPIDVAMRGGYGSQVLNIRRQQSDTMVGGSEFPLTLGRDFSGVVVETGKKVHYVKPGDLVWGALDVYRQGSHTQYTLAMEYEVSPKPTSLDHVHAASLPYVAVTVWNAITKVGQLTKAIVESSKKRVLVLGASGGVGTFAVQLLKAWGAEVTATCSTDAVDLVTSLGADYVIDYTQGLSQLKDRKGYDFALDTTGDRASRDIAIEVLKPWSNSVYVTTVTPLIRNFDSYGPVLGLASSGLDLSQSILQGFKTGVHVRWSFFSPSGGRLFETARLVDQKKISPVVSRVFPFEQARDAYEKVEARHMRGKVVLEVRQPEK